MKITKTVKIIMLLIIGIFIISNNVIFAVDIDIGAIVDDYRGAPNGTKIKEIGSIIYSVITDIAVIVSVAVIAFLGVKYMLGSVEERAEYKKSMLPYLVGAVLVFGATTITNMVMKMIG